MNQGQRDGEQEQRGPRGRRTVRLQSVVINPRKLRQQEIPLAQQSHLTDAQEINREREQQRFNGQHDREMFAAGIVVGCRQPDGQRQRREKTRLRPKQGLVGR